MGLRKYNTNNALNVGSGLTLEMYARILHDIPDGFITVATKSQPTASKKGVWNERNYPVDEWIDYLLIDDNIGCYQSMNSFYRPKRGEEFCRSLHNFYVDVDCYNVGLSREDVVEIIDRLVENGRLPEPTLIMSSGRGMYVIWNFESTPGKFTGVKKLYSHIQDFLIDTLKDAGSDSAARDLSRMLKFAGSTNPKTKERVEVLRYSEKKYTMRYMQDFMNDVNDYQLTPKKNKKKKAKILKIYNFYTLAVSRAKDLEKLCVLRSYDMYGFMNTLLHIYSYQLMLIHQDMYVVRHKTTELNNKFLDPLPQHEINSICKDSARAFRNKKKDKAAGYNYRTKTIIKKLKITEKEQISMSNLIGDVIKQERDTLKKREIRGSVPREEYENTCKRQKEKNISIIKKELKKNPKVKQVDLVNKLGLSKGYVSKLIKEISNK